MKILKYVLLGAVGLVVLAGAVLAYIAATFDPNQYKPQIVQAVKEKTQRTLKLEGDIGLALFPSIGARLGKAALTERASDQEFAAVQDLRVAVKLIPLLSRQVVLDTVEIKGLRARLVRFKDGKTNFGDLGGGPAAAPAPGPKPAEAGQFKIDIAHVRIEDSAITYIDQAAGAKYELSGLNLKTGRIASGVPSDIDLSFVVRADKPKIDLRTALKTRLVFDLEKQRFALEDLDLTANGAAAGISELTASAKGALDARPASTELAASKLAVTAKGKHAGEAFVAKFDLPRLNVTQDKISGEKMTLDATLGGAKRNLVAKVEIPGVEGNAKTFSAARVTANVDMQDEGAKTSVKMASPLTGSIERQHFELPKLVATVNVASPRLPKSPIEATINGALGIDAAKQLANLTFATKFDESTINGRAGLAKFTPPTYTFDLSVDKLDADRYLQKSGGSQPAPKGEPKATPPEQPIDVTALKDLNASGTIRIGSLKVSNVKTSNVRLDIKAANGRLDVNPIAANLYKGSLAGALAVNAAATPTFTVKQKLSGIDIGPLLKDLADKDMLEGRGNVALDVTAQGNTMSALKKALGGTAALRLTDGALKGINIAGSIRSAKAKLGTLRGEQVQQADKTEKTDFSELSATFNIKNGVAHNNDLSMKSPLLRVGGEGNINIGDDSLDYLIKAAVVGTTKGQGGRELADLQGVTVPVRVSGPLDAPSYKLDFAALATDAAKQRLEGAVKERIEKQLGGGAQDGKGGGLKDRLKGLFGR